jgi:hypothetical protein
MAQKFHQDRLEDPWLKSSLNWAMRLELTILKREAEAMIGGASLQLPPEVFAPPP